MLTSTERTEENEVSSESKVHERNCNPCRIFAFQISESKTLLGHAVGMTTEAYTDGWFSEDDHTEMRRSFTKAGAELNKFLRFMTWCTGPEDKYCRFR